MVLKESQEGVDPFVFSSVRFVIAAAVFSPFIRRALRDEKVVKAGMEIGALAAGGEFRADWAGPPIRQSGRRRGRSRLVLLRAKAAGQALCISKKLVARAFNGLQYLVAYWLAAALWLRTHMYNACFLLKPCPT